MHFIAVPLVDMKFYTFFCNKADLAYRRTYVCMEIKLINNMK